MNGLTEKDAGTKWCPFARAGVYAGNGAVAVNRHVSDDLGADRDRASYDQTRCIGSACMAWRWVDKAPQRPEPKVVDFSFGTGDIAFADALAMPAPERPADVPAEFVWQPLSGSDWEDADGGFWIEPDAIVDERYQLACDKRQGRCGLAGGLVS